MSVRPVSFNADGSVAVVHDEAGHGGTVALVDLAFARNADGSLNADWLAVPCPVAGCGAVSLHPVSGGVDPGAVQKLFLRTVLRKAVALGIPAAGRTFAAIKARVKARVLAMDGDPTRWRLERMTGEDDTPDD